MFRLIQSEIALFPEGIRGFRTSLANSNHYTLTCSPIFMLNLEAELLLRGIKYKDGGFAIPGMGFFETLPILEQGYKIT